MSAAEAPQAARTVRWLDRWGLIACFIWGFAEATLFFIVPDVIVGAVALVAYRKAPWAVAAAVGGAVLGGSVLFIWAQLSEPSALAAVEAVPAVHPWMFADAGKALSEHGGIILPVLAFTGIPYKVAAMVMSTEGWPLLSLAAWTIPGRALRFALVAGITGVVGWGAGQWIRRRPWVALGVWLAIWVGIYADYWIKVGF